MALNAGLRAWHARRRKERQTAVQRINARLDTAGIPEDKRAAVSDAYGHYLAASAGGTYAPTRYRDDAPPLPSGVTSGPAVDWSGYALADDYA